MRTAHSLNLVATRIRGGVHDRLAREAIVELELHSANDHSAPWTLHDLDLFLGRHNSEVRSTYQDKRGPLHPVGWIAYSWDKNWNFDIFRVAVLPDARRHGVGRWLVDCATRKSAQYVSCVVPERDLTTQVFMRACGFRCTETITTDNDAWYYFQRKAGQ